MFQPCLMSSMATYTIPLHHVKVSYPVEKCVRGGGGGQGRRREGEDREGGEQGRRREGEKDRGGGERGGERVEGEREKGKRRCQGTPI